MIEFLFHIPCFVGNCINWFVGAVIMVVAGIIFAQLVVGRTTRWLRRRGWIR